MPRNEVGSSNDSTHLFAWMKLTIESRFAWAELNMALATIFRRFDLQLYETTKERDVDYVGDCFLGLHHPDSLGVRVKVIGLRP